MKKTILTLSLFSGLCAIGLSSCNKIKESLFPAFTVQLSEVTVAIPITVAGVESSARNTVSFSLDSAIKAYTANAFGIKNLSSVKVKGITATLTNEDALNDLSNFEMVRVAFSSNTVTTPAVVVSAVIPDKPTTTLNIAASNAPELKEYLQGNQLTYVVSATARRTTTKPLNVTVSATLSVK